MGPSPHLWFLHAKQRLFDQNYKSLWVPGLTCRFVHAKQRDLTPDWQVYMGSRPHLWFCACTNKHDFSIKNYKSVWVPDLTCGFRACKTACLALEWSRLYAEFQPSPVVLCMQNSVFKTRITSLYGSQTWPVILYMYNSVLSIRITSLYGSQPSPVVFALQNSDFGLEL